MSAEPKAKKAKVAAAPSVPSMNLKGQTIHTIISKRLVVWYTENVGGVLRLMPYKSTVKKYDRRGMLVLADGFKASDSAWVTDEDDWQWLTADQECSELNPRPVFERPELQDDESLIPVYVVEISGHTHTFWVKSKNGRVRHVLQCIGKAEGVLQGVDTQQLTLVHQGHTLHPGHLLSFYGVQPGSTLHVIHHSLSTKGPSARKCLLVVSVKLQDEDSNAVHVGNVHVYEGEELAVEKKAESFCKEHRLLTRYQEVVDCIQAGLKSFGVTQ